MQALAELAKNVCGSSYRSLYVAGIALGLVGQSKLPTCSSRFMHPSNLSVKPCKGKLESLPQSLILLRTLQGSLPAIMGTKTRVQDTT